MPIYPREVCQQVLNGSQESQNMGTLQNTDACGPDLIQSDHFEIPEVEFKNLELNRGLIYSPTVLDIPTSSMLKSGVCSSHGSSFMLPTMHPHKRLRESQTIFPSLDGGVGSGLSAFNQSTDYFSEKITESFDISSQYDSHTNTFGQPPLCVLPGSHALLNDNSSSSEPLCGAMKLELPSLQYPETQQDSWGTPNSPLPSLESVDTLILSPPAEQTQSDCLSPRSSGLLEAVLYESQTLKNSKKCSGHQTSDTSVATGDVEDCPFNTYNTEWEVHHDPNSPLGHSAASVFSACTPISGSSSDEPGKNILHCRTSRNVLLVMFLYFI